MSNGGNSRRGDRRGDRRRTAVLAAAYAALVLLALAAWLTEGAHLGGLTVIPILVIAYYLRPAVALAQAFAAGILLAFLDQMGSPLGALLHLPRQIEILILPVALCAAVLVANRLQQETVKNVGLRERLARAQQAAEHDPLTALANRRYFLRALAEAMARNRPGERVALLFCDLDRFKNINDIFGHLAGDNVLRLVAARLQNTVRAIDVVARLGGDEFGIVACNIVHTDEAQRMAANIERSFNDPIHAGNGSYSIGITVGIALYPDDATDEGELLRIADARMYQAKNGKRSPR